VLLLTLFLTRCLRWSSAFSTQREKSMHDLAQRTLQACRRHILSHARSLPCFQRQCHHHAMCESSRCHVLVLTLPLRASSYTFSHTLPLIFDGLHALVLLIVFTLDYTDPQMLCSDWLMNHNSTYLVGCSDWLIIRNSTYTSS